MAEPNISQVVNSDWLEKLADGTYKKKHPSTTPAQAGLGNIDGAKQMVEYWIITRKISGAVGNYSHYKLE